MVYSSVHAVLPGPTQVLNLLTSQEARQAELKKSLFFLSRWTNAGINCHEMLWTLHMWRCSKARTRWSQEVSSNLNDSVKNQKKKSAKCCTNNNLKILIVQTALITKKTLIQLNTCSVHRSSQNQQENSNGYH